jgi:hypothetical protein
MNSNIHKNENENDDVSQRFQHLKTEQPSLYEQKITTINKEEYTDFDDMTTTTTTTSLERTPIRRFNLISGPRSAFARLFPDKYRQQEESNKQRSKSTDHRYSNIDLITIQHTTSDDDDDNNNNNKERIRKSRRVRFHTDEDNSLKSRTKSESYLNQIHLNNDINYDPNPEIIYRDNPDDIVYTQRVGVRYLKPPTPPPPGPILIREVQSTPPTAPPPLVVSTTP